MIKEQKEVEETENEILLLQAKLQVAILNKEFLDAYDLEIEIELLQHRYARLTGQL